MGLSIHYNLVYNGSMKEILSCLHALSIYAEKIGFEFISEPLFVDYSTPNDHIDCNSIKEEHEDIYRWAKLQYELPKIVGMENEEVNINKEGFVLCMKWRHDCVPLNFGFIRNGTNGRKWVGAGFIKTQWSNKIIPTHVSTCKMLNFCNEVGIICSTYDESNFYDAENPDETRLIDFSEMNLCLINNVTDIFKREKELVGDLDIFGPGINVKELLKEYRI